jgi:hypothetical protein
MGSRQDLKRHSVTRMIGEIKLLLNDEDCLYYEDCLYSPSFREPSFSETEGIRA